MKRRAVATFITCLLLVVCFLLITSDEFSSEGEVVHQGTRVLMQGESLTLVETHLPRLGMVPQSEGHTMSGQPGGKKKWRAHSDKLAKLLDSLVHEYNPPSSKGASRQPASNADDKVVKQLVKQLLHKRSIVDTTVTPSSIENLRALVLQRRDAMEKAPALCGDHEACAALKAAEAKRWQTSHDALAAALEKPALRNKLMKLIHHQVQKIKATAKSQQTAKKALMKQIRDISEGKHSGKAADKKAAKKKAGKQTADEKKAAKILKKADEKKAAKKKATTAVAKKATLKTAAEKQAAKKSASTKSKDVKGTKTLKDLGKQRHQQKGSIKQMRKAAAAQQRARQRAAKKLFDANQAVQRQANAQYHLKRIEKKNAGILVVEKSQQHAVQMPQDEGSLKEDEELIRAVDTRTHRLHPGWEPLRSQADGSLQADGSWEADGSRLLQHHAPNVQKSGSPAEAHHSPESPEEVLLQHADSSTGAAESQLDDQIIAARGVLLAEASPAAPSAQHAHDVAAKLERTLHVKNALVTSIAARAHATNKAATLTMEKLKKEIAGLHHARTQTATLMSQRGPRGRHALEDAFATVVKRRAAKAQVLAERNQDEFAQLQEDLQRLTSSGAH